MTTKVNENIHIVVLSLYLAGGKTGWAHLEDIAIKADELAPGKYRWEKHKNFISDRIISSWLSDASKEKYGSLIISRRKQARINEEKLPIIQANDWRLTEAGVRLAEKSLQKNHQSQTTTSRVSEQRQIQREKERLLREDAYLKYSSNRLEEITKYELENFFKVNEYFTGEAKKEKVSSLKNMFSADATLIKAINYLAKRMLEKANG